MGWYEFSEETVKPVAPAANHVALYPKAGEWYFENSAGIEKKLVSSAGTVQVQIYYVGKHGSDSNDGKSLEFAFLTFGKAITEINLQSPGQYNPYCISCLDAGIYTENLTLAAYVSVFAPNTSFIGNHVVGDGCRFTSNFLMCTSGTAISKTSGTISGLIQASLMQLTGAANGTVCTAGSLDCQIDTIVNAGTGYVFGGSSSASLSVIFNVILLTSVSGGSAINFSSSGTMSISGNTISDIGFSTGIITSSTGVVSAKMAKIACVAAVNVGVGSTLNLLISSLSGTETNAGTYNVTKAGAITDPNAIHKNIANEISTITEKTAPVAADLIIIEDSGASGVKKKVQLSNITKAEVKSRLFLTEGTANYGDYRVRSIGATGTGKFSFNVPSDFNTLISLEMIFIPTANISGANIDLSSDYAAKGELSATHSESDTTSTYTATADRISSYSIAQVFSALALGDYCGLTIDHNAIGTTLNYFGVRIEYI